MKKSILRRLAALALAAAAAISLSVSVIADETSKNEKQSTLFGSLSGTNGGDEQPIGDGDPHTSWQLGEFYVTGYSRVINDGDSPVYLKALGGKLTLYFKLEQDPNRLNGNDGMSLSEGVLTVTHTDRDGKETAQEYNIFPDLKEKGSVTKIEAIDEGDYRVCFRYAIALGGEVSTMSSTRSSYKLELSFSVRNNNCSVSAVDIASGAEMTDSPLAKEGFSLDLSKSRYLEIEIEKGVLSAEADAIVTDKKYSDIASDSATFTEEGVYAITVRNPLTGITTEKLICVGGNDLLRAHTVTGLSIKHIKEQLSKGYTIDEDGTLVTPSKADTTVPDTDANGTEADDKIPTKVIIALSAIGVLVIAAVAAVLTVKRRK